MRAFRPVSSALAQVVGLACMVISGCAGTADPSSAIVIESSTTVVAPSTPPSLGALALRAGPLLAGAYTTTAFKPTLHFRMSDGWRGLFRDDSDEIAFETADGTGFFAITRVTKVVDPKGTVPVPDDLVGWLATNSAFRWSGTPVPVTVGGLDAVMIDGSVKAGLPWTDVFAYDTGNMRVMGGDHIRYYVVPLDGPDLTIVLFSGGGDDGFETKLDSARVTLDSLEIVGP